MRRLTPPFTYQGDGHAPDAAIVTLTVSTLSRKFVLLLGNCRALSSRCTAWTTPSLNVVPPRWILLPAEIAGADPNEGILSHEDVD